MKMKWTAVMLICLLLLSGCRFGTVRHTIIDWVDFLKVDGITYTGTWHSVLTDPGKISKEIGKVRFKVSENVHDSKYKTKDGDAAFLEKGTSIYEVVGYPVTELVAVADRFGVNGYRIFVEQNKQLDLDQPAFEKVKKVRIAQEGQQGEEVKVINELSGGSASFFMSVLSRGIQSDSFTPSRVNGDPKRFRFVLDSGESIGYKDYIYYDGERYYTQDGNPRLLPSEIGYYFIGERDVAFRTNGMAFTVPGESVTVASGETIKRDGSMDNITLISADGSKERTLFSAVEINNLWDRIRKEKPGSGEAKTQLFASSRPTPVSGGRFIAFESNKNTVLNDKTYFDVLLIDLDGKEEKVLIPGSTYGYSIILDAFGDRLIAETEKRSLLDVNVQTGAIREYPINAHLVAMSSDGRYVLYQKMESDALVGKELWAFDLEKEQKIPLGQIPEDFIYNKGIK
ncbi:hypothetical protein QFZ77_006140 [Paenibacillus sp. V4I3]|uniref:hypothetical protein n=1 Tax=Paenibacillus sp. V4I3 TaxID=3042305 RepID=UPI002782424D|nr:hypothetical protein [Paenibacillus sp. V4I3]MDQ0877481.1 hypothetical protein [Paenibacillus sp. V4I3]